MVLRADDELRHPHTDLPEWRESMWWCFDMPEYEMGGAIYYAYVPNGPNPSAKLITYITRGWNTQRNRLMYTFEQELPIPEDEWDDLRIGRVAHFKRLEPLKRWQIALHDGKRLDMELDIDLFGGSWHWIDNPYETPKFLAGDRYHRPYLAHGEMRLDGSRYPLNFTGDSDHSWGPRRWGPLFRSKYVAGQCGRDWAMSFIEIAAQDGSFRPYGFIWDGQRMSPVTSVEVAADYDADGLHRAVLLNIVDSDNRLTRVEGACFANAPTDYDNVSNNDCYFNFEVNRGEHRGSGILSFFWEREYYRRVLNRGAAQP